VLEVGTYQTKAGYAGEDTPKFVFPSVRMSSPKPCCTLCAAWQCTCTNLACSCGVQHHWHGHLLQSVGAVGGGPDGMEVDGAKRTLYVGTHALSRRRDHMEVRLRLG
jgi:actin-related protein